MTGDPHATAEARLTIKAALDLGLQAWRTTPSRERFIEAHDAVDALAAELASVRADLEAMREAARRAKSIAAAPDYDEEAIRDALWAVVDAALAASGQTDTLPCGHPPSKAVHAGEGTSYCGECAAASGQTGETATTKEDA